MRDLNQIFEVAAVLFIFVLILAVIAWVFQLIIFSGLGIFGLILVCVVIACMCRFIGGGT